MNQLLDRIIEYEDGEMHEGQKRDFFADLIQTGDAWRLQGHYQRTAEAYIDAGIISKDGVVLEDTDG